MTSKTTISGNSYEVLAILAGTLRESEVKKELEKWEAELAKLGKILAKIVWPNRPLAYKVAKNERGTYLIVHLEAAGKKIAELENALRLDPKVIRHLIARTPKQYVWRDYSEEDLEHDFTKLESAKPAPEPRFVKKKGSRTKPENAKPAAKKVEKEAEPTANAGEIDKKLDDILADL
ncbi:MAG: 30S ribosomal protein S6 [Patescibacteria group bacterium]